MLQPRRAQHADQPGGLGQGADVLSRMTAHMSRISGPARGSPRDWPHTPPAPHQDGPIRPATDHRRAHHRRAVSAHPRLSGTSRDLRMADLENSCKRAQLQPRTDRSYRTLIRPDGRTDRTPFGDRRSVPGRRIGAANRRPERANRTPLHGAVGRAGAHCPWPPQALTDRDRSTDPAQPPSAGRDTTSSARIARSGALTPTRLATQASPRSAVPPAESGPGARPVGPVRHAAPDGTERSDV
jgi:hypothetical protein